MHQGEQESVTQLDQEGQPRATRPRRARIIAAASVAAVLVLGGSGGVAYAQWNSGQNAAVAAALSDQDQALRAFQAASDEAREVLAAAEGKVADDQVRRDLADMLGDAPEDSSPVGDTAPSRAERAAGLRGAAAVLRSATAAIAAQTEVVAAAQASWELEQATAGYDDAVAALNAARDAGAGVLAGSEGKVADNAVRQTLTDAIDAGNALLTAPAPAEVRDLTAAAASIADATTALTAATTATTDAQSAWQAEQDRIAAEQAAAAAAQAARSASPSGKSSSTGKSSTGKSSSSGRTSGGSKSGGTSSGSSGGGTAPASGGGSTWSGGWDTGNSDTVTRCMDTAGNVWSC